MHHCRKKEELGLTTCLKAEATMMSHHLLSGADVGTNGADVESAAASCSIVFKPRYKLVLEHFAKSGTYCFCYRICLVKFQ